MAEKVRTFVAIEIPHEVQQRAAALIARLEGTKAKVKWVRPHQLHWTLKFLGDVELREVPEVCDAVQKAVAEFAPFDVEVLGAGAFPDLRRPRTVWLGVGQGAEPMVALHASIDKSLKPLGYRPEGRKFRPHITIGRVRSSPLGIPELGKLIEQEADFSAGVSAIYEVVVFSSDLGRDGPTYDPLAHAELKGR